LSSQHFYRLLTFVESHLGQWHRVPMRIFGNHYASLAR